MNDISKETFAQKFNRILHIKFEKSFPDTFIKSQTHDEEVYKSANGSMYSWYIIFLNAFNVYRLEGEYRYEAGMNDNEVKIEKFLKDLETSENWLPFLIQHMPSK